MKPKLAKYKITYDKKDDLGNWLKLEDDNSSKGYTINNVMSVVKELREDSNIKNVQLQDYKAIKRESFER